MTRAPLSSLHDLTPKPTQRKRSGYDWADRDRGVESGKVIAHLGDIASPLEEFIRGSEAIVGCVAWITSGRLVTALAGRPVSIIVNKEWALRSTDMNPAAVRNRETFSRLRGGLRRRDFPAPLSDVAGTDDFIAPLRCVGYTAKGATNLPLMHHKFIVRLERGRPVAVWTGSFNFTVGAERSFENAVEIHDPKVAAAYLGEWARVAALSEPMEFKAGKAEPDWAGGRRPTAAVAPAKATVRKPATRAKAKPAADAKKPAPARSRRKAATPSTPPTSSKRSRTRSTTTSKPTRNRKTA